MPAPRHDDHSPQVPPTLRPKSDTHTNWPGLRPPNPPYPRTPAEPCPQDQLQPGCPHPLELSTGRLQPCPRLTCLWQAGFGGQRQDPARARRRQRPAAHPRQHRPAGPKQARIRRPKARSIGEPETKVRPARPRFGPGRSPGFGNTFDRGINRVGTLRGPRRDTARGGGARLNVRGFGRFPVEWQRQAYRSPRVPAPLRRPRP
jgi:hypothetical protein